MRGVAFGALPAAETPETRKSSFCLLRFAISAMALRRFAKNSRFESLLDWAMSNSLPMDESCMKQNKLIRGGGNLSSWGVVDLREYFIEGNLEAFQNAGSQPVTTSEPAKEAVLASLQHQNLHAFRLYRTAMLDSSRIVPLARSKATTAFK